MSANISNVPQSLLQVQLASKYLSISMGIPLCICGTLGNLVNLFVFFTLGNYKLNASSFYALCRSFFDLITLIIGLCFRVLYDGFQMNFSSKSLLWCKIRIAINEVSAFNSFTCLCLQSIDAFFCTSSSVILRQKSNIRTARYIMIGLFFFLICHQVPYVIFQDLVDVKGRRTCQSTNAIYIRYRYYFVGPVLGALAPIGVITAFGLITYRQLHRLDQTNNNCSSHRRSHSLSHLTRQMTTMTLFQIVTVTLCQIPFIIIQVYIFATDGLDKSPLRQAREQLIDIAVVTLCYGTYASSFYCYCAASKRFRRQVWSTLNQFHCHQED